LVLTPKKIINTSVKGSLRKGQHMRNLQVTLSLKRNKVTLNADIKDTFFPKIRQSHFGCGGQSHCNNRKSQHELCNTRFQSYFHPKITQVLAPKVTMPSNMAIGCFSPNVVIKGCRKV